MFNPEEMKRLMQKAGIILSASALGLMLISCGTPQSGPAEAEESTAEEVADAAETEAEEAEEVEAAEEPAEAPTEPEAPEEAEPKEAWQEAYAGIVTDWDAAHSAEENVGYGLIYLNDDDIPELTLFGDEDVWYAMDIYTFADGEARRLVLEEADWDIDQSPYLSPGWQGKGDVYCEKEGIYFQTRGMMGDSRTNAYVLDGNSLRRIIFYEFTDLSWNEEAADPYQYILEYTDSDGKDVSIEQPVTEEDAYYDMKDIPEAGDLEQTFGFSFDNRKDMYEDKVSFDEIMKLL